MTALAGASVVGALLFAGWRDIRRFIKIKMLSMGGGHPELVPAGGRTTYPGHTGEGTPNGKGDFDSASRGGPARA